MKQNCCVLIPAYQPPEKFLEYAAVLRAARRKFCPHCRGHRWGAAGIHAGKLYSGKPAQPVRLPCGGRARSCRAADAAKALRRGRQRRLLPHWKVRHLAPPEGRIKSQCAFVPPLIRKTPLGFRSRKPRGICYALFVLFVSVQALTRSLAGILDRSLGGCQNYRACELLTEQKGETQRITKASSLSSR